MTVPMQFLVDEVEKVQLNNHNQTAFTVDIKEAVGKCQICTVNTFRKVEELAWLYQYFRFCSIIWAKKIKLHQSQNPTYLLEYNYIQEALHRRNMSRVQPTDHAQNLKVFLFPK